MLTVIAKIKVKPDQAAAFEAEAKKMVVVIRTSEVLAKTDGKWLYLVDHASVGAPPPPPPAHARRGKRR